MESKRHIGVNFHELGLQLTDDVEYLPHHRIIVYVLSLSPH